MDSPIDELLGPFSVSSFEPEKTLVILQDDKGGSSKPFDVVQVKPYLEPTDVAHRFISDLHRALSYNCTPEHNDIYLTEITDFQDPRADRLDMTELKNREIQDLLARGTLMVLKGQSSDSS